MRSLLFCLFGLLLFASCSEERQLLNRIEGVFDTTEFIVTDATTGDVLFTASPTFQFVECDPNSNRDGGQCDMTIIDTSGTSYDYRYQLDVSNEGNDFITFQPLPGFSTDQNDLTRALTGQLAVEIRDEELRMYTSDEALGGRSVIQGSRDYRVSITADKR